MNTKTTVISEAQLQEQYGFCDKISAYWLTENRTPTAYVETYGCQQNEADSEKIRGYLTQSGYAIVHEAEGADVVVMNTCAIREHAEQRVFGNLGALTHTKRRHPAQKIFLCGCMAGETKVSDRIKKSYPHVDGCFSTHHLWQFPEILWNVLSKKKRQFYIEDEPGSIAEGIPQVRDNTLKSWVSIMYGCNNFCTYCIVPYVRGRERSRHREDILAECERLISEGVREITLLGQNVNSYGRGLYEDYDFADLLREVCSLSGDFTVRFMTSHPKDATEKLFRTIAECPKAARHFHLPLQSGSTRILKEMNRKYTFEAYYEKIKLLRSLVPDIAITSDLIVAFPGETEEDFQKTLDAVALVGYDMLYSFIYSPRKGTPAAEYEGQIPKEISSERFARLLELQNAEARKRNEPYVGRTVRVLCEGESKTDSTVCAGKTSSGKIVFFPEKKNAGDLVNVKIERCDAYSLYGNAEN